jgi:FXSXX-COOH protein
VTSNRRPPDHPHGKDQKVWKREFPSYRLRGRSIRRTREGRVDETSIDLGTDLADLSDMMLDDLRTTEDTPLARSIRRILEESRNGHGSVVAGHETHI